MTLLIRMKLRVKGTQSESQKVAEFNARIAQSGINGSRDALILDDSLGKDFNRILADMKQLFDRARARQKRR